MKVVLGRTGLRVNQDGFGALPMQRVSHEEAAALVRAALDGGIDFIDTARVYSDSEEKLGAVLPAYPRGSYVLATKTTAGAPEALRADLETSLSLLRVDCIDVYQLHNPARCPLPGDGSGLYEALLEARAAGKIRFIGITNHRLHVAREAVESGLYDTLQFPFSYLSGPEEERLVALCAEKGVGFIAMKALAGGLLNHLPTARKWMQTHPNAAPIWGIQHMAEMEELLALQAAPDAPLSPEEEARIERDRRELGGAFCRGCGYCLPCPEGIEINMCARMGPFLRRSPVAPFLTPEWQAKMELTKNCTRCGQCAKKCPYGLKPYDLLAENYKEYRSYLG